MSKNEAYPIRLDTKILDAVRPIAKREGRTLRAQLEWFLRLAMVAEPSWMLKAKP